MPKISLYIIILFQLLLCSCQKIIDIDLNEGSSKYVISADTLRIASDFEGK